MKKEGLILLALVLVFGFVVLGCGSTSEIPIPPTPKTFEMDEVVYSLKTIIAGLGDGPVSEAALGAAFLEQAGGPTIAIDSGKMTFTGRTNAWDALDIKIVEMATAAGVGVSIEKFKFEITVKGNLSGAAGKMKLAMPDDPYTTLKEFDNQGDFEIVYEIPADYPQAKIRIQPEGANTADFNITEFEIVYKGLQG